MEHKLIYKNNKNELAEYGVVPYPINEAIGMKGIVYYVKTTFLSLVIHNNLVKEVINMLESDSYDHGAEWRETKLKLIKEDNTRGMHYYVSVVSFRVKDSY